MRIKLKTTQFIKTKSSLNGVSMRSGTFKISNLGCTAIFLKRFGFSEIKIKKGGGFTILKNIIPLKIEVKSTGSVVIIEEI